jgi:hypothetical protein
MFCSGSLRLDHGAPAVGGHTNARTREAGYDGVNGFDDGKIRQPVDISVGRQQANVRTRDSVFLINEQSWCDEPSRRVRATAESSYIKGAVKNSSQM